MADGSEAAAPPRVGVVIGSRSDLPTMEKAVALLEELGIPSEIRVISAHRAPGLVTEYAAAASGRGLRVLIAAAGLAAHLPGVLAAQTELPVIGVPMPGQLLGGLDALLSIVQMPRGVPVATVGVGNAENAALLAAQILALSDADTRHRLVEWRRRQTQAILDDETNVSGAG